MRILNILFLLSMYISSAMSCATCLLMVPTVEVDAQLQVKNNTLSKMKTTWNFSETYTNEMYNQYDKNRNKVLDEQELAFVLEAMLDYLIPKNMITTLNYTDDNTSKAIPLQAGYENFKLSIKDDLLVFSYDVILYKKLEKNANVSIVFEDDEGYFVFVLTSLDVKSSEIPFSKNTYLFTGSILFNEQSPKLKEVIEEVPVQKAPVQKTAVEIKTIQEEKPKLVPVVEKSSDSFQEGFLKESMKKIKSLFESIKDEKNPMTYLLLLFFAYAYGVIHAMGPGHGKTLVASYFLSNDRSYVKALGISLAIGVVHTFSAFILTIVIYYFVNTLLAQFLDDTVFFTTKLSAVIIIFIALYLINKKYRLYKKIEQEKKKPQFSFSTSPLHVSTCGCGSCKVDKDSTDIALIISAGIIPCPGTTTLFIFAISTGLYYAGFISALVMSLGMSSVIFVSALLSTVIRKKVIKTNDTLKKYLEFTSLALILVLGGILLFV